MYYFLGAVMWLIHLLPQPIIVWLGNRLGSLFFYLAKERRQVGLINLGLCFPLMSEKKKQQIIHDHFQYLTTALLQYSTLWFASKHYLTNWIRTEGEEHFRALGDQPIILLAPHFVGLDVGGLRYLMTFLKGASMYAIQKNKSINRLLLRGRSRFAKPQLFSRQDGVRGIIRSLRNGTPLYYLPDQDYGPQESIFVPFFGVSTATIDGLARLAKAGKARVVPAVTRREGNHYVLKYYPAWENFPTDDIAADTRRMNAFIEARILETPEQYFWLHKRFKTRPQGEKPFYPNQKPR
jgi:KDO2-lipid IV(A) lauroyltransferase